MLMLYHCSIQALCTSVVEEAASLSMMQFSKEARTANKLYDGPSEPLGFTAKICRSCKRGAYFHSTWTHAPTACPPIYMGADAVLKTVAPPRIHRRSFLAYGRV